MRHVKWAVVIGLVALAVVAVGALQAQQLSGEYKIGVLEPLTGNLAAEGKRHLEGYEIVRDLINERGGVMGKKLVFVVGDAVDPTVAASEATRLATREGVKIITGTFSSTPHPARAQERVPDRDRRHRVRLVQRRVHRQAPRAPARQEDERAAHRVSVRGFLVRPERHRVRAAAGQG